MARTVQIRDLDDDVYAVLRGRAGAADLSLSQYLRRELSRLAELPTMGEWLDRVDAQRTRHGGVDRAALDRAVAEARDERDARLDHL